MPTFTLGKVVGPQGPQGQQGATGPQGPQGIQGPPGIGIDTLNAPEHASGSVVTFTSAAAGNPVNPLIVNIEPLQSGSGDPSPENIRPITGWTGATVTRTKKNLWGGNAMLKSMQSAVPTATVDGTNITYRVTSGTSGNVLLKEAFKPNTRYTIIYKYNSTAVTSEYKYARPNIAFYYSDGTSSNFIAESTTPGEPITRAFVSEAGKTIVRLYVTKYYDADITLYTAESGLFEGVLTTSDFEPYVDDTYTISFGSAGTVYGGTLDVARGLLTVDRTAIDLGTLTYGHDSSNKDFYVQNLPNVTRNANNETARILSDRFTPVSRDYFVANKTVDGLIAINSSKSLIVRMLEYTIPADFKAAVSGSLFVYTLATPEVYQLTPQEIRTLLGVNNLWADCGDVDVTYRAGTDSPVMTADDVGVAGGAASYSDYAALEARVAALEAALANS